LAIFNECFNVKNYLIIVLIEKISDISESPNLLNANKHNFPFFINMNSKYMFIVATMAVLLVGATAFATDNAFADGKKKYGKNQATAQANACGNDKLPMYVFCQNTNSQIQGEENEAALGSAQGSGEDHKDKKDRDHDKDKKDRDHDKDW
jgi:hypothetical protein